MLANMESNSFNRRDQSYNASNQKQPDVSQQPHQPQNVTINIQNDTYMTYNLSASKRDDSTYLHFDPNNQEEQFQNDHSG